MESRGSTTTHTRKLSPQFFPEKNTANLLKCISNLTDTKNQQSTLAFVAQLTALYEIKTSTSSDFTTRQLRTDAADALAKTPGISPQHISRLKELIEDENIKLLARIRGIDFDNAENKAGFLNLLDEIFPALNHSSGYASKL